jgi:superfamily II DNA/RNA helicase
LPKIAEHLKGSAESRMFFFVNHVGACRKWSKKLSEQLALANLSIFVLEIHGEMDKNEKFYVIRLFTNAARLAGMEPQVLVGTSAGNTGIDQP